MVTDVRSCGIRMPMRFADMTPEEVLYDGCGWWTWTKAWKLGVAAVSGGVLAVVFGAISAALKSGSMAAAVTGMTTLLTSPVGWFCIIGAAVTAAVLVAYKL